MLGDALFNIRSAFDHLVLQLVLLDGGEPEMAGDRSGTSS
jgi:hypothetical protein